MGRQRCCHCRPGATVWTTGAEAVMRIRCTPARNPRDRLHVPIEHTIVVFITLKNLITLRGSCLSLTVFIKQEEEDEGSVHWYSKSDLSVAEKLTIRYLDGRGLLFS